MGRGAWRATVQWVAKSRTQLSTHAIHPSICPFIHLSICQSTKVRAKDQLQCGVRFARLCYWTSAKGHQGGLAELWFDLPLWDAVVSSLHRGRQPHLHLTDGKSEGAWDLVVMCFPGFLPNGVFFFFGLTLIQEPWGRSCPPSQGRHTCWLHLTPRWGYGFGGVPKPPRGSSLALPFPKGLMGLDCACTVNRHCVPTHDSPGPALLPREPWVNPCAEISA